MPGQCPAPLPGRVAAAAKAARRLETSPAPAAEVRLMMQWPMRETARRCGMMSPHRRPRRRCSGPPPVPAARGPPLMPAERSGAAATRRCEKAPCQSRARRAGPACQKHAALRKRATLIAYTLVAPIVRGRGWQRTALFSTAVQVEWRGAFGDSRSIPIHDRLRSFLVGFATNIPFLARHHNRSKGFFRLHFLNSGLTPAHAA